MKQLIRKFIDALAGNKPSTGMTFIRKYGAAPKKGCQIVVFVTMIAVPNDEAERIKSEWHSPTLGACAYSDDAIALVVSTGEGRDISKADNDEYREGTIGNGIDGVLTSPVWRF